MINISNIFSKVIVARGLVVAISLFLAVIAPLVSVDSASAHSCTGNKVCFYQNKDFGGPGAEFVLSGSGCYNLGYLNDQASSVVSSTPYQIRYYQTANCNDGGCYLQDTGNSYRRNFANDRYTTCSIWSPNDDVSSFKVYW